MKFRWVCVYDRCVTVLCLLLLVGGCIISWKPTSIGHIDKVAGWEIDYLTYAGQGATRLEGQGLRITIRPQNEGRSSGVMLFPVPTPLSSWGPETAEKFWITVDVRSKTKYTLDPFGFRLNIQSTSVTPYRVIQRDVTSDIYLQCTSGGTLINPREVAKGNKSDLWPPACFDVYFEIPMLSVDHEFDFVVRGAAGEEGVVNIPKITFTRGRSPSGW